MGDLPTETWTLGIDFGTSTTFAAHSSAPGRTTASIRLSHNAATMPSSVFVESPERLDVGDVAIDKSLANPTGFLSAPKRTIAHGSAHVNGYDIPASVPVAAIFRSVIARAAREHDGNFPESLVITHPESWSDREIKVLLDAAAAAGYEGSRVKAVSEARAAAHYYTRAKELRPGSKIAVFDYGGGTLDVAVLSMNPDGSFQVLAADGDVNNGGRYLDSLIRAWVDDELGSSHPETLAYLRSSALVEQHFALADSITRAKELLSEARMARISVPTASGSLSLDLSRATLEQIIDAPLQHAHGITEAVLQRAGVASAYDLEALYLTGGSSRIPLVAERLGTLGPISTLDDPKAVVALGALTATHAVAKAQHLTGYAPDSAHGSPPVYGAEHSNSAQAPTQHTRRTSAPTGDRTSRRGALIAGASIGAVVVVALGALAWWQLSGSSDDAAPATGTGHASAAPPVGPATEKEEILAVLPPQLSEDLDDCELSGETKYGGIEMQCEFVDDARTLEGLEDMEDGGTHFVTLSADPDNTASTIAGLRSGIYTSSTDESSELLENDARTAAAGITKDAVDTTLEYCNTETHITLQTFDLGTVDNAKQFLNQSGLLPQ